MPFRLERIIGFRLVPLADAGHWPRIAIASSTPTEISRSEAMIDAATRRFYDTTPKF